MIFICKQFYPTPGTWNLELGTWNLSPNADDRVFDHLTPNVTNQDVAFLNTRGHRRRYNNARITEFPQNPTGSTE